MHKRSGFTVVETLVVVAIVGILLALLAHAIAKVRATMLRVQSSNNLKQIMIALHHHAADHGSEFPMLAGNDRDPRFSLCFMILAYIEADLYRGIASGKLQYGGIHNVRTFVDPADWTLATDDAAAGLTSYAANGQVFQLRLRLPGGLGDGMSNTIAFGQHYGMIHKSTLYVDYAWPEPTNLYLRNPIGPQNGIPPYVIRRASFADYEPQYGPYVPVRDDVYPIVKNGATTGSIPNLYFQVQPQIEDADPRICQSPHSGGMLVAMADGSVRMMAQSIKPNIFWSLVTPNGGEAINDDW
jgi:prepilin-type N-terminal cleavage/methylation domain-containing protein